MARPEGRRNRPLISKQKSSAVSDPFRAAGITASWLTGSCWPPLHRPFRFGTTMEISDETKGVFCAGMIRAATFPPGLLAIRGRRSLLKKGQRSVRNSFLPVATLP